MRLIVERLDGVLYAYREREALYRQVKGQRTSRRLEPADLDIDCQLPAEDFYLEVRIKKD